MLLHSKQYFKHLDKNKHNNCSECPFIYKNNINCIRWYSTFMNNKQTNNCTSGKLRKFLEDKLDELRQKNPINERR